MQRSKELGGLPAWITTPDPSIYWSDNYVVLDFETTTLFKGTPLVNDNRIVLASWRTPDGEIHSHFGSEFDQHELVRAVESADFIVAHNAKFELGWLRRCGVDLRSVIVYDTMLGEYIIGGNRFTLLMLSLSKSLGRYGLAPKENVPGLMFKAGFCSTEIPRSWLKRYCERDVDACHELFLRQRDLLRKRNLIHLQYARCLLTPALADIECNGMMLDEAEVDKAIGELEDDYAKATAELQEFMGGVPPASTVQKADYVFNVLKFQVPRDHKGNEMRTKSGAPSIAAGVVEKLRPQSEKQQQWLDMHTEWAKMHSDLTKYLRKFKDCCVDAGGHLRAVFNQCSTRTHRLSSSGLVHKVQFQNLNRKFKPIFKARTPGWLIGEADGAQLEFRIATHLGRDKQALHDITNAVDIHAYTASIIGCSRQDAKAHTFKPLYGGKSGAPEHRKYYDAFAEKYHQIASTQRGWTHKVLNEKKLTTEYGLVYHWPDCKMSQSGWIKYTTNIYNYPVQGFATAEIIPLAIVCAWHRMSHMESFLVNTVHDSIIAELHPEEVKLWHEIAKQCLIVDAYMLLDELYNVELTVPLGAGVMIGSHWSNAEAKANETVYNADPKWYEAAAKEAGML